jgi:hypothetical protein
VPNSRNERLELETKILRYRRIAGDMANDEQTSKRVKELVADPERQLRAHNVRFTGTSA